MREFYTDFDGAELHSEFHNKLYGYHNCAYKFNDIYTVVLINDDFIETYSTDDLWDLELHFRGRLHDKEFLWLEDFIVEARDKHDYTETEKIKFIKREIDYFGLAGDVEIKPLGEGEFEVIQKYNGKKTTYWYGVSDFGRVRSSIKGTEKIA